MEIYFPRVGSDVVKVAPSGGREIGQKKRLFRRSSTCGGERHLREQSRKFLGINASSIHVFHLAGPTRAVVTLTSFVLLEISCQVTSFRCERYMDGLGWMDKVCSMYVNTLNNSIWSMRKFDDRRIYCISN